jgi:hypothetical protein
VALYDVGCYAISASHLALGPALAVERAHAAFGPTGVDLATTAWLISPGGTVPGGTVPGARAEIRCGIALPDRQQLRVTDEAAAVDFTAGEAFTNWHQPSSLTITTPGGAVRTPSAQPPPSPVIM